ncbi:hypothetical protein CF326_g2579 [Tilletia indica]|nr:hypothetical protein CF326_g2579 [Tilletia indica]
MNVAHLGLTTGQDAGAKTVTSAIEETLQSFKTADQRAQLAAGARTKAYAGLMAHMEKMYADGHVGNTELQLLLATCKAAHRHAEAGKCAPDFPHQLVSALASYDVKNPETSLRKIAPGPAPRAPNATVTPSNGNTYSAVTSRTTPPATPFAHLKDKHIVGQGKGSAVEAAKQGGRRDDRLFARLTQGAPVRAEDPLVLVNRTNEKLSLAGAPHSVRIDVVSKCTTGLALSPKRGCDTQQLYAYREVIAEALGAGAVDMDELWERWVIHEVPTHAGSGEIDDAYISNQLSEAFPGAVRGFAKRLCKKDEDWTTKTATPVAFYTTTKANFFPGMRVRILGRQFQLRRHQLRPSSIMCGVCGSYRHKTTGCESASRCRRCAQQGHSEEEHVEHCPKCKEGKNCVPLCMHCRGPHPAGDRSCRNKPVWDRFAKAYVLSSGQELSRINAQGDRSRNKMLQGFEGPTSGANRAPLGNREQGEAPSNH